MDKLEAIGDPELRATFLFARSQDLAVTADEVADARHVHRNVARSRLERLVTAGLLVPAYEHRGERRGPGAGRPAKIYAVAPEVAVLEFPTGRYEGLIGVLLDALPVRARARRLRELGLALGEDLAGSPNRARARSFRAGLQRLCEVMKGLGYQAALVEVGNDRAVISTATCPLRPLVRSRPEVADLDRGMWSGLAARVLGPSVVGRVECETQACLQDDSPCRVLITLRSS